MAKEERYDMIFMDIQIRTINSDRLVVDLIRDSGATPIAFVEKDNNSNYCATLNSVESVKVIENKLLCL